MYFLDYEGLRYFYGKILARIKGLKAEDVGAAEAEHSHTASEVGARPSTWTPTASEVGAVPSSDVRFKLYSATNQFSSTIVDNTATVGEIVLAMPAYSVLDVTFWGGQFAAIESQFVCVGNRKRLVIEKGADSGYTVVHFYDIIGNNHWYSAIYTNDCSQWTGWIQDVKTDGSVPMIGDMHINKGEYPQLFMKETTTNARGHIQVHGDGVMIESTPNADDENNRRYIMLYGGGDVSLKDSARLVDVVNGTKNWYHLYGTHNKPTAADVGALSADGSVPMTGALTVQNATRLLGYTLEGIPYAQLLAYSDGDDYTTLQLNDGTDISTSFALGRFDNGVTTHYGYIFGDHNKPAGEYTGNGSATTRYINIDRMLNSANGILIRTSGENTTTGGTETVILVGKSSGAFGKSGTSFKAFTNQQIGIGDKQLIITTADAALNANGVKYKYYVL